MLRSSNTAKLSSVATELTTSHMFDSRDVEDNNTTFDEDEGIIEATDETGEGPSVSCKIL